MNPMIERLESITARYEELGQLLLEPATLSDNRLMAKLAKEQASLTQTVEAYEEYKKIEEELVSAHELLHEMCIRDRCYVSRSGNRNDLFDRLSHHSMSSSLRRYYEWAEYSADVHTRLCNLHSNGLKILNICYDQESLVHH